MVSDMIEVVQGSLGSGKSLVAVSEAIAQLKRGGVVACNFAFSDLWAWNLSGQDLRCHLRMRNRFDYSRSLYKRAFQIGNPESMHELSGDEGRNLAELCTDKMAHEIKKGGRGHRAEGKGLLILDDCHHFFNSRTFAKNKAYVEFFANARKWGWRTILITHSINNIDVQIRSYVELESRFRNLKKVNIPYTPFPMSPINAFIIVRRYAGLGPGSAMVHSKDFYLMDKVAANMYNTLERFSADQVLDCYKPQGKDPAEYVYDSRQGKEVDLAKKQPKFQAETWPKYYQRVCPENAQNML